MSNRLLSVLFCVTAVVILLLTNPVHAAVPRTLTIQGRLTDVEGHPVADGDYKVTFRIYDDAEGTTELWSEEQDVTASRGLFQATLGSVEPLDLTFEAPYWLGITMGGRAEMTPLIRLTGSPYSLASRAVYGESNTFPSSAGLEFGRPGPRDGLPACPERGVRPRSLVVHHERDIRFRKRPEPRRRLLAPGPPADHPPPG